MGILKWKLLISIIIEKKIAKNDSSHSIDIIVITKIILKKYTQKREKVPLTEKNEIFQEITKVFIFYWFKVISIEISLS